MANTTPHPTPRHRIVCHATAWDIAAAPVSWAPGEKGCVERGARGLQRTGYGQETGRHDGVSGPAHERI